ncbi:paeninodin family lasso peptide [Halalkalibacter akibai]|nr:paeninodin family lasso peptide [Halalkalibacter akibai]
MKREWKNIELKMLDVDMTFANPLGTHYDADQTENLPINEHSKYVS